MYLGYQNGKIKFYTETKLDTALYNIDKVEETQEEYIFDGEEYVLKDEAWEEKQAQKERERIALLNMTGADVERAIYKVKGIDFDDILAIAACCISVFVANCSPILPASIRLAFCTVSPT